MTSPQSRTQLCFIVQQFGFDIIQHGKRCKGMLSDLAPEHRLDNRLLISALEQKIAQELLHPGCVLPIAQHLNQLTQRLQDTLGITQEQAYWAVETWALALNVMPVPLPKADEAATEAEAAYQKAKHYYDQQDYANALPLCQQAAGLNHADGQNLLGVMYQQAYGVGQNLSQAAQWYRKAAEQGHADGQNNLGFMFQRGYGVPANAILAVVWYRKAAEQGHAWGQNNLGWMFQNGYGLTQDHQQAVAWYRKAAEQGNTLGQSNLGWMYQHGHGVAKDDTQAVSWYRKAAEQGYAWPQNQLGYMYEKGYGVGKDLQQAKAWYQKAAEQGLQEAQTNLEALRNTLKIKPAKKSGSGCLLVLSMIVTSAAYLYSYYKENGHNAPFSISPLLIPEDMTLIDGIAIDNQRGLTWLRFAYGQKWQNNKAIGNAQQLTWQAAIDAARKFNQKGGYAGYTDWRLPTKAELATLIDTTNGKQGHYINADLFPNSNGTFWSRSPYENDNSREVWVINFSQGISTSDTKKHSHAVRLVRGKQHG